MPTAAARIAREAEGSRREGVLEPGPGGGKADPGGGTAVGSVDGRRFRRRVHAEDDGVNLEEALMPNMMGLPGPVAPASSSSSEKKALDR